MGSAFDVTSSYGFPLVFCSAAAFTGAVLMLGLGPYPFAAALGMEGGPEQPVVESPCLRAQVFILARLSRLMAPS
jgi:hypothetical protein